jgi:preprotein translocase subunit SecF
VGVLSDNAKPSEKKTLGQKLWDFYDRKYKLLLIFPFIMLVLAIGQIAYQVHTTGDFIAKDVSLKGGVTVTVQYSKQPDVETLQDNVNSAFGRDDVSVRVLKNPSGSSALVFEAPIDGSNEQERKGFVSAIQSALGTTLGEDDYSIEIIGSSLGASFFRESIIALIIAFIFMGIVILLFFRILVPSFAVILAALSDILISIAVVNLMGVKIGTAGIAAFLMLIGYSVDTNILLTVRVLKRKEGHVMDRVRSSIRTGMTITYTALVAALVALFITNSDVIRQIMIILLVGLLAEVLNTWVQNVGILRLYIERKQKKGLFV